MKEKILELEKHVLNLENEIRSLRLAFTATVAMMGQHMKDFPHDVISELSIKNEVDIKGYPISANQHIAHIRNCLMREVVGENEKHSGDCASRVASYEKYLKKVDY